MCQQLKDFEKIGVIFPPFYQQQTEKGPRRCSKGMIYTSDITNVCLSWNLKAFFSPSPPHSAIFMFSRLATVLQELSGEEGPDGDAQVREQHRNYIEL